MIRKFTSKFAKKSSQFTPVHISAFPKIRYTFAGQNFNLEDYDNFDYKIPTQTQPKSTANPNLSQEGQNAAEFLQKLKQSNSTTTQSQENVLDIKKFKHMIHNSGLKPEPMTEQEFTAAVEKKFNHVSKAFNALREADDRVQEPDQYTDLATNDVILYIDIEEVGNYLFRGELSSQDLIMNSSESGVFRYLYDAKGNRWVCKKDGHLLDEILLRELMGKTKSYLAI